MSPQTPQPSQPHATALDVLLDIELPVTLRFGRTQMLFGDVMALGAGSLITFEAAPEDPVDVLVNDRLVARGEVVMAGGNYAVRVTGIASQSERIDSSKSPEGIE